MTLKKNPNALDLAQGYVAANTKRTMLLLRGGDARSAWRPTRYMLRLPVCKDSVLGPDHSLRFTAWDDDQAIEKANLWLEEYRDRLF